MNVMSLCETLSFLFCSEQFNIVCREHFLYPKSGFVFSNFGAQNLSSQFMHRRLCGDTISVEIRFTAAPYHTAGTLLYAKPFL